MLIIRGVRVWRIELQLHPWEGRALPLRHTRENFDGPAAPPASTVRVDLFDQDFLGRRAHNRLLDRAALEEQKRRDVINAEFLGELLLVVDVDLHDLDLVGQLAGNLVEQRRDHFAGTAPFGPEIDDDQFIGLQDLALEVGRAHRRNMRAHTN